MSFDKDTRNLLAKTVTACRRRLTEDVTDQLTGVFGLHPDGTVLALKEMSHLSPDQVAAARCLRDLLDHYTAGAAGGDKDRSKSAYERMTLEISFTILNRLAALRLCEERGLVVECVRRGTASDGFRLFERVSGGALGGRYDTYRVFLECLFDELALDLGVLFDRTTPQSSVFPTERCMEDVLGELNKPELTHLWTEDETIGWVYQYFNPPDERKAMRDASQAPRNSRELAVRNQFFTPRYVVEFLTDNTLGRIWYEMRKGDTTLKEECRYLVRRPDEVFLGPGEKAPAEKGDETDLSQEELLEQPVYIEHRPKKDPRDLRILDPACGSGHFLLYAFDLLEHIYEEAWSDLDSPKSEVTGRALQEDFKTLDDLYRETPKLIVEHNLHGIDIDPRAVQIAALALWLRAQKTWKKLGIKAADRPRVAKSNIVTAESMPGEADMKEEFTAGLKPRVLGQILDEVFEKMKLAGEAGSLLKIDEDIKDAVAAAGKQWREGPKPEQQLLFPTTDAAPRPKQQELRFDVKGITDERFWEQAEDRILDALKNYSEQAENGRAVRRRLFAEDAARGFAFVDLCRNRYDVVLMNPPFGDGCHNTREFLLQNYVNEKHDLAVASVTRGICLLLSGGLFGAITTRTPLFLTTSSIWREERLIGSSSLTVLLDLGLGILDGAMNETAAYVAESKESKVTSAFFRLLGIPNVELSLEAAVQDIKGSKANDVLYLAALKDFRRIPTSPLVYWVPASFLNLFKTRNFFESGGRIIRQGGGTTDDFRFTRLKWEVNPRGIGPEKRWSCLSQGEDATPYFADVSLLVNWANVGKELKEYLVEYRRKKGWSPHWAAVLNGSELYLRAGLRFWRRSRRLTIAVLPKDCVFTKAHQSIFSKHAELSAILAAGNTRLLNYLTVMQRGGAEGGLQFEVGLLKRVPYFNNSPHGLESLGMLCARKVSEILFLAETSSGFGSSRTIYNTSIRNNRTELSKKLHRLLTDIDKAFEESEKIVLKQYGLKENIGSMIADKWKPSDTLRHRIAFNESGAIARQILSWAIGGAFGRWDVRIAIDRSLAPKLPDPFDPLPVCPPGMLVGPDGLPAESGGIVSEEWLRARPDANTLPPEGSVMNPTIPDSGYPLRISWDGVLVDDPGFNGEPPHREDIVRRTREVFDLLWEEKAQEIEQEACDLLGVSNLRDYFRKPSGFFQDHLKRYSKSRRKAPIYWPLSTASGSYTVWLYYHRLDDQKLYGVVNSYVGPKISDTERRIARLENDLESASGKEATTLRDHLNETRTFLSELQDLRDELLRIAELPYKPNLNDGVIINAAPFHKLFRLRSWAKDTEKVWNKLDDGDYNWAHLAYTIWPDRVRDVCKKDRSIAIAHGLEELCEVEAPEPKAKGGGRRTRESS